MKVIKAHRLLVMALSFNAGLWGHCPLVTSKSCSSMDGPDMIVRDEAGVVSVLCEEQRALFTFCEKQYVSTTEMQKFDYHHIGLSRDH